MNDIEKRIEELTNELNYHNHKYYVDDAPEISDFAFDKMLVELEQLEEKYPEYKKKNSPTVRVGGEAVKSFGEVHHDVPMLSQQKAFSKEEILDFDRRVRAVVHDVNYVVEQKIDGLSVSLEYVDGEFTRGSTRGDGINGEDVTENLKTIKSIPLTLKDDIPFLEVRGEVFLSRDNFNKINDILEASEQPLFANPRNAAAGSLRQLDPKIAAKRNLDIFVFNIQQIQGKEISTHIEGLEFLKEQGFKTILDKKSYSSIEKAYERILEIGEERGNLYFDIDGAVIKVNELTNNQLPLFRKDNISFIFQQFALMKHYTVYENIEMPLRILGLSRKEKKERIFKAMEELGIADLAKKKPAQISGGQQQRCAIARALVKDSKLILADEPTGALDRKNGKEIMKIFTELKKKGKTIIIVTHDPGVAKMADRIINIEDGKII